MTDAIYDRLAGAAAEEGASLLRVEDRLRPVIADLVTDGDRTQFSNREWRQELASWMRPRRKGDGLAYSEFAAPLVRLVVSAFNVGGRAAGRDGDAALSAPLLAVLATGSDGPAKWLRAGEALEHVLLEAAAVGLQASYLNQPCELPEPRHRLQNLLPGAPFPQLVLRIRYPAQPSPAAPRRPPDAVIKAHDGALRPATSKSCKEHAT